jgi:Putative transposase of IS4/5 family (DUF4096)
VAGPMSAVPPKAEVKSGIRNCRDGPLQVDGIARRVIQAPKPGPRIMRYELTDFEWVAIQPFLPNKPRGVPRVNDRRVLNGILWVLRSHPGEGTPLKATRTFGGCDPFSTVTFILCSPTVLEDFPPVPHLFRN